MENFKVIIYDCDGVLVDSRRANEAFYNIVLERFGMPPLTPDRLEYVLACTAGEAVEFLFRDTPFVEEARAFMFSVDNDDIIPLIMKEPHVGEVLERLRETYHTAVASNRGRSLRLVLEYFDLDSLFDMVVSSFDVSRPKPDPECLVKILDHFRVGPKQALYIGDSDVDRALSEKAGVLFAAYKNSGLKAGLHLDHHRDLLKILSLEP